MTLNNLSATQIGRKIIDGELTSQEATAYFIAQIKTHNPEINAVIAERFEAAMEDARAADEARDRGDIAGPLHGVPMTIKDAFEVTGLTCDVGAPNFANIISENDAVVVQRLKQAGAIILGKTNTPLFCADWQSYNALHGTTNNPHNLAHTPGGSSGGSTAALAAGMTPLEYGSDIGGSIRIPAHYCGLFGHKPTLGIVPPRGHVPPVHGALAASDLSVVGPLGKYVADIRMAFDLTVGLEPPASQAMQIELQGPRAEEPEDLRIGVWASDAFCEVDSEIEAAIIEAADKLAAKGATLIPVKPDFSLARHTEVYMMLLNATMGRGYSSSVHARLQAVIDAAPEDDTSWPVLQARGARLSHAHWQNWHEERMQLAAKWAALFEQVDVIFCPVSPTPAMAHDQSADFTARKISVNGAARDYFDNIVWPGVATLCGLPATSVPLARHSSGLPFGMQIVGPAYEDNTPLAVAQMLEDIGYGWLPPENAA